MSIGARTVIEAPTTKLLLNHAL